MSAHPHVVGDAAAAVVHELSLRGLTIADSVVVLGGTLGAILKQVEDPDIRRAFAASVVRTVTDTLDARA